MRLRSYTYGGGLLVLVLIVAAVMWSGFQERSISVSVDVHSYQWKDDELFASLVLTNIGAVPVSVPLRFECQVEKVSGFTNYFANTRYKIVLQPRQHMILRIAPMRVQLPEDAITWKVSVRIRQSSGRERLIHAFHRSGLVNPRILSRLAGQPREEADYRWHECRSGLLEVPRRSSERSTVAEDEPNGA